MKRELWTVQDKRVLEELLSSGCYRVKRSYVMEKYGESAWSFQTAYDFFIRELRSRIAALALLRQSEPLPGGGRDPDAPGNPAGGAALF